MVTGANRGLGFEFARQLLARGDYVVGACRTPGAADELQALLSGSGTVVQLDVSDAASVREAATVVAGAVNSIDLLINAAGVEDSAASRGPLAALDAEALLRILEVNVVGIAIVTRAFAPLLNDSSLARVVNLTSRRGLLERPVPPGNLGYAVSKTALNMLTCKLAAELPAIVIAISPGWVQTDMGGPDAPLTPQQSVAAMLRVIDRLGRADTGAILGHDGTDLLARHDQNA